jgi:hypothetical protein
MERQLNCTAERMLGRLGLDNYTSIMKSALLSLAIILIVTACSPKAERTSTGTPQFSVVAGDITSASAESEVVHIEFSKAKAEALRKFTKEHLNQKIQVVVGTNVVAEPVVRSEIPGGQTESEMSGAWSNVLQQGSGISSAPWFRSVGPAWLSSRRCLTSCAR